MAMYFQPERVNESLIEKDYEEFDSKIKKRSQKSRICAFILLFFCVLFLGLAIGGPFLLNMLIHNGLVDQRLVTSNESTGYKQWQSNNGKDLDPEFLSIYLFNVTNPDDIIHNGSKPILQEVGPFIYTHHHEYFDIEFSEDQNEVNCKKFEKFIHYSGDPTTLITVANIPYAAVRSGIDSDDDWYTALAFDLLTSAAEASPFTTVSVQDYIFGYNSPLLSWINKTVPALKQKTWFELQHNGTSFDEERDFLLNKTDTYYTGKDNLSMMFQYKTWHGMDILETWNGTDANKVRGTDGSTFELNLPSDKNVTIFVDTMYRHSPFWYNSTEEIRGITMRSYWIDPRASWNHSMGGPYGTSYTLYGPHGVNNMTMPELKQQGAPVPVFIGLPYFFQADESYTNAIEFLEPYNGQNKSRYNTVLSVEPITGLCMSAKKRIQISIQLKSTFMSNKFPSDILFPVAWLQLESTISEVLAKQFRDQVYLAITIRDVIPFAAGGISLLFCLISAALFFYYYREDVGCCVGSDSTLLEERPTSNIQYFQ